MSEKTKKQRRIQLSDDSLNSYGFRVLTSGIDLTQYERNPVLLYMHERGNIIGILDDLRVEGSALTAVPCFDEASEQSRRCKAQYEFGSLRMASVSFDPIETSHAPEDLVAGQTRPTVTKCRLVEVSLVDIGSNPNSIVLVKDGKRIELTDGAECALPLLKTIINPKNQLSMTEQERIALAKQLGLPETASVADIQAKVAALSAQQETQTELQAEVERLRSSAIERIVLAAISQKRIGEEQKSHFMELGKKLGAEDLEKTLNAISPQVRLSDVIPSSGGVAGVQKKWTDLSESELVSLRKENRSEYARLYEAEFGCKCEIED